jgi:hypothetical protein
MAIERRHGCVDVEYPRLGQKRRRPIIDVPSQPCRTFIFANCRNGAPHGILANDLVHPEKLWKNAIATPCRDMSSSISS